MTPLENLLTPNLRCPFSSESLQTQKRQKLSYTNFHRCNQGLRSGRGRSPSLAGHKHTSQLLTGKTAENPTWKARKPAQLEAATG
jgi:hypothetical protein